MNFFNKIVFLSLLLTAGHASALEYNQLQADQSAMSFAYRQMGVPMTGKFGKFAVQISFDPARLASAQAHMDVNLASIDTGSTEADEEVVGKLWFNARNYPLASFVSTGVKALGGNRYQASGRLSIKGRTLDVTAPFTFQPEGNRAVFDGSFNIQRLAYAIGEGEWTDLGTVANEVQIKFHLVVSALPATPSSTQSTRKNK